MNFLNPLVLIGLVGASIPILLHLLNLRKLKKVEFSSLKFIKELKKSKIKKVKLKQILLLILRTLAIIFAVLAFSRPTIKGTISGFESFAKTGAVIIVDNSYSMDANTGTGNSFRNSISYANSLVDFLKPGDEAIIMPANQSSMTKNRYNFSTNKATLKKSIREIDLSYAPANFEQSVFDALTLLQESKNINKEVYIVSDLQNLNFIREMSDSIQLDFSPTFYLIPVSDGNKIENVAIDSVNVETNIFEKNAPVNVSLNVTNYGTQKVENSVLNLYFNGKKSAQRTFSINANETKTLAISGVYNESGFVDAALELETDELDADNKYHFGFIINKAPNVAVFSDNSGLGFIRAALEVIPDRYSLNYFRQDEVNSVDLNRYDVVLYNGAFVSTSVANTLNAYVSGGKSALIFAPDSSQSNSNAAFLGSYTNYSIYKSVPINEFEQNHPFFKGLFKTQAEGKIIEAPELKRITTISKGKDLVSLLGKPLLSEFNLGEGKVLYLSLTPTLESGSFPITSLFPALINRSILYLNSKRTDLLSGAPSEDISIPLSKEFGNEEQFKVIDPNKIESFTYKVSLPSGNKLVLNNNEIPGAYKIETSDGTPVGIYTINPNTKESNLKKADEEAVERFITSITQKASVNLIEYGKSPEESITRVRLGTELWKFFVIATLLCLLLEMVVARVSKNEIEG